MNPSAKVRVVIYWATFVISLVVGAVKAAYTTLGVTPTWFQVALSVWAYVVGATAVLAAVNVSPDKPRRALEDDNGDQVVGSDAPLQVWTPEPDDTTTPQARLGFRKDAR